jgi:hypothetical protein
LIDIYYLEKNPCCPLILSKTFHIFHFLYTTIVFYIFDNTLRLSIRPLNTTVRQLKKTSRITLISTVRSLHIDPFLLQTSHFQPVVQIVLYTVKKTSILDVFSWLLMQFCKLWSSNPALQALIGTLKMTMLSALQAVVRLCSRTLHISRGSHYEPGDMNETCLTDWLDQTRRRCVVGWWLPHQ